MTLYKSAMKGVPITLLTDKSALNEVGIGGISIPSSFRQHKLTIKGSAGILSGKIQPESADNPAYSGTWNPLGGGEIDVPVSSEIEYNFEGIYSAIRARVSTVLAGGTVTIIYVGS